MNATPSYHHLSGNLGKDLQALFNSRNNVGQLPFTGNDSSVGMEYELQVAVAGNHDQVDLPIVIGSSTYYKNIVKRCGRGDLPTSCLEELNAFLYANSSGVWENSWVRFAENRLSPWAKNILATDFLSDKANKSSRPRSDLHRFQCLHQGEQWLRLPISDVLKLSLADAISGDRRPPKPLFATGSRLLSHFLSDNTSPEIISFTIPVAESEGIGILAAKESARTLLFCQLLTQYANKTFGLEESGQKCLLYSAPTAPLRQKKLNSMVPDAYYRHLFISPCLSGWDRGEEKHRYMELCHKTLSRSQLNTIGKLKDAGIITRNLVALPNTSNTCLSNNGTHVSLGSRILTALAASGDSPFTPGLEKSFGDLVIKIVEHFLPLFVNTYSAAPCRLDFTDFHPERILGFLPHELDFTHLRMIWRRWQKKARISVFGKTVTPFGPHWLDRTIAKIMGLRGDLVPDFRLIDYLVTLLSTETSPGLNGMLGNQERLKQDLGEMGIFDPRMSIYLPYRQRIYGVSGYAGFEGRSYSLFHNLQEDMAEAVELQNLITALACRYVIDGMVQHDDIPDRPSIESERRQIFFGRAIGIPTFYVRADTGNRFLHRLLRDIPSQRASRRYKGYIRIQHADYNLALLKVLQTDGADLIESQNLGGRLLALQERLLGKSTTAFDKIAEGINQQLPGARSPFHYSADQYNSAMERYYRTDLRTQHKEEGLAQFLEDCRHLERINDPLLCEIITAESKDTSAYTFIERNRQAILLETADPETLRTMIFLALSIYHHKRQNQ